MPFKDNAARRAYDKKRDATPKRKAYNRLHKPLRPFVGVDGEGGNLVEGGRQEYLLLRAGEHVLETGKPLTPYECISFLADLPHDVIYVSFFFDYDVTMICRDLPVERWHRLLNRSQRINRKTGAAYGVDLWGGEFQIDYLPTKEFRVRKAIGEHKWANWITVHDTGSFFQQAFVTALKQWFSDDAELAPVIEKIAEGKAMRNDFGAVTEYERGYNLLEVRMLARLMERFRDVLEECDIPMLSKWQGPGNIAAALFNKHGIPKRATHGNQPVRGKHLTVQHDYPDVVTTANQAYYGGRFEPLIMGYVPGPIYQYDINSAYAAMYTQLPCLLHGEWMRCKAVPKDTDVFFLELKYKHTEWLKWLGIFPNRTKDGTIQFPLEGHGVFTGPEIRLARKYNLKLEIIRGWKYKKQCDCTPFHWVPELYRQRKAPGQGVRARIFKLALASIYGKLAQSVGDPVYSNPIWASLITGTVRAQLAEAALQNMNGAGVIMLATDGIFTRLPINLPLGEALGEWDLKIHDSMFVVQSGVYFAGEEKPKTRGVPMKLLNGKLAELRNEWTTCMEGGFTPNYFDQPITVMRRTFTGMKMALHLGKPEKAGTWSDEPRGVTFNYKTKRVNGQFGKDFVFYTDPILTSPETKYYTKDIGGMSADGMVGWHDTVAIEQPDWVAEY